MPEWPWRYRSRSKVISRDTPSHASDHLCLIWKESIQNCRRYRADTTCGTDGRTDGRTEWNQYTPPTTSLFGGYNELQCPLSTSWIEGTRWITSKKLKLNRQLVIIVENHILTDRTDERVDMRHTIIRPTSIGHKKNIITAENIYVIIATYIYFKVFEAKEFCRDQIHFSIWNTMQNTWKTFQNSMLFEYLERWKHKILT